MYQKVNVLTLFQQVGLVENMACHGIWRYCLTVPDIALFVETCCALLRLL